MTSNVGKDSARASPGTPFSSVPARKPRDDSTCAPPHSVHCQTASLQVAACCQTGCSSGCCSSSDCCLSGCLSSDFSSSSCYVVRLLGVNVVPADNGTAPVKAFPRLSAVEPVLSYSVIPLEHAVLIRQVPDEQRVQEDFHPFHDGSLPRI